MESVLVYILVGLLFLIVAAVLNQFLKVLDKINLVDYKLNNTIIKLEVLLTRFEEHLKNHKLFEASFMFNHREGNK